MKIQSYQGRRIRKVLANAPYDWRATGTYGVERALKNGQISKILLLYVNSSEMEKWRKYLKSNSIQPTKTLPDLRLVGVDTLPKQSKKDKNSVDISHLIEDLAKVAPRYQENHPEVIDCLKDVA